MNLTLRIVLLLIVLSPILGFYWGREIFPGKRLGCFAPASSASPPRLSRSRAGSAARSSPRGSSGS